MSTMLELSRLSPAFFFKKLMNSPRDLRNPRGFHGTTKTWEQIKSAPLLYLSCYEDVALTHLANRIQTVGTSVRANMIEVEFPDAVLDQPHALVCTGTWNEQIEKEMEAILLRKEAAVVAHYMEDSVAESLCFVIRTEFCRPVFTRAYEITMVNELAPAELLPGGLVVKHEIAALDHAYRVEPLPL